MLTEQHLDKLAHQIVDRFFNEKVALTDGVVDTARQENLNPEQIKRLVESVNNLTFLKKFNNTPQGQDRVIEFETANANAAIQRLLDAAKDIMGSVGTPCPMSGMVDDSQELPFSRAGAPEPLPPEEPQTPNEPRIQGTMVILKLRKTAELLNEQKYQARATLTETLEDLTTRFTRADGPNFATFEKDAFYQWGDAVGPFLQIVRRGLRLPPSDYDHTAITKVARIIDSSTSEMRQLRKIMSCHREIKQLDAAQEKVAEYLKKANEYVRR